MEYIQLTMDDYIQCKAEIKENLGGIVKSFVRIGWQLTRIRRSEAYRLDGYSSIAEFARAEYGMNPSGVSRFISVYERYSEPGDTPELKEPYREFNFSQLSEMLQLPEEDLPMIQPETKREDIRELSRFNRENEHNPEALLNWRKEPEDKLAKTIMEFFKADRELLNELYESDACRTGDIKEMTELVNPSGNRNFHKGTVFLAMRSFEKGILVKEFGQGSPYDLTWERFFSIMQEIFKEAAAGPHTWENYFEPEEEQKLPQEPETEKAAEEAEIEKRSKNSTSPEEPVRTRNPSGKSEIAPAQSEPQIEEKCQETAQIPGQDTIENHPECIPKPEKPVKEPENTEKEEPEIAPAQSVEQSVRVEPITRKEYIDSLTVYGTAGYLAETLRKTGGVTSDALQDVCFWESWLRTKVDRNGRTWIN